MLKNDKLKLNFKDIKPLREFASREGVTGLSARNSSLSGFMFLGEQVG
jgi:hypothetical protein